MKKFTLVLGVLVVLSMILASCSTPAAPAEEAPAEAPAEEAPAAEEPAAEPFKACLVTDSAGIGDKSFNDAVWGGLERAVTDSAFEANYSESRARFTPTFWVRGFRTICCWLAS